MYRGTRQFQSRLALVGEPVYRGTARIRHTEHAGNLIKAFAHRIVACAADFFYIIIIMHNSYRGMTARRHKGKIRRGKLGRAEIICRDMPFYMVYGDERLAVCISKRLCKVYANKKRADKPRACRDGYGIYLSHGNARAGERIVCYLRDCFAMRSACYLGHNAAEARVHLYLRCHYI